MRRTSEHYPYDAVEVYEFHIQNILPSAIERLFATETEGWCTTISMPNGHLWIHGYIIIPSCFSFTQVFNDHSIGRHNRSCEFNSREELFETLRDSEPMQRRRWARMGAVVLDFYEWNNAGRILH